MDWWWLVGECFEGFAGFGTWVVLVTPVYLQIVVELFVW